LSEGGGSQGTVGGSWCCEEEVALRGGLVGGRGPFSAPGGAVDRGGRLDVPEKGEGAWPEAAADATAAEISAIAFGLGYMWCGELGLGNWKLNL